MKNIKVLIVEDEWIVSEEIKELLTQSGFQVVGQAEDAESALQILAEDEADVALLDINIKGGIDGIQLAHEIIQKYNSALIFLTAFDDEHFINRAKEIKPAAYIVKPFQARNLEMAIEMAFNNLLENDIASREDSYVISDHIFLRDNSRFKKIALEDITYVEAVGSYTDIYTSAGKFTLSTNLKAFENQVDHPDFMRVHRSYVVNLSHVDELEGNRLFINQVPIPISSTHKEAFLSKFKFL